MHSLNNNMFIAFYVNTKGPILFSPTGNIM